MRATTGPLLILCVFVLDAAGAQDDVVKKDIASWQGTWKIVTGEGDGQPLPDQLTKSLKFFVKGDRLFLKGIDSPEKNAIEIKLTLDPSTNPKVVDFQFESGNEKGKVLEGIYELKGDQLKFCVQTMKRERPEDFVTSEGSNRLLFVLQRVK